MPFQVPSSLSLNISDVVRHFMQSHPRRVLQFSDTCIFLITYLFTQISYVHIYPFMFGENRQNCYFDETVTLISAAISRFARRLPVASIRTSYPGLYLCVGGLPGPILFGFAIDHSCLLWEENCDGSTGSCLYYDNHQMAWLLLAVCASCKVLNAVCGLLSWQLYVCKRRRDQLRQTILECTPTVGETGSGATGNSNGPMCDIVAKAQCRQANGISNAALDVETREL